jgi:hypothetical protein
MPHVQNIKLLSERGILIASEIHIIIDIPGNQGINTIVKKGRTGATAQH